VGAVSPDLGVSSGIARGGDVSCAGIRDCRGACIHEQARSRSNEISFFPRPDPRIVAWKYLRGEVSDEVYFAARDPWWAFLEGPQLGNFRDPEVLLARLALCLLYATPDEAPRLAEPLSWFFEVLELMGKDVREPEAMIARYFAHSP
jgi:hypothetical protein